MSRTATERRPQRTSQQGEMSRSEGVHSLPEDLSQYLREYAREQPEMAALWCLGIGFVLGWKLKPW